MSGGAQGPRDHHVPLAHRRALLNTINFPLLCCCGKKLTQSRCLVLQSDLAPVQFYPVQKIISKLDALFVLKDDEPKAFLLFGFFVLRYGHPFQRPSVQEQFIQNLIEW